MEYVSDIQNKQITNKIIIGKNEQHQQPVYINGNREINLIINKDGINNNNKEKTIINNNSQYLDSSICYNRIEGGRDTNNDNDKNNTFCKNKYHAISSSPLTLRSNRLPLQTATTTVLKEEFLDSQSKIINNFNINCTNSNNNDNTSINNCNYIRTSLSPINTLSSSKNVESTWVSPEGCNMNSVNDSNAIINLEDDIQNNGQTPRPMPRTSRNNSLAEVSSSSSGSSGTTTSNFSQSSVDAINTPKPKPRTSLPASYKV